MERAKTVVSLNKELLGPRNGIHEMLDEDLDPRNEYITGILIPKQSRDKKRDVDSEAEIILTEDDLGDEAGEGEGNVVVTGFSPALDPKSMPKSLGLSFVVKTTNKEHKIHVLYTWGRYYLIESAWIRKPEYYCFDFSLPLKNDELQKSEKTGLEFNIKSSKINEDTYKVSVFLVNNTNLLDPTTFRTEDCVFQPQIRVKCEGNINITPFEALDHNNELDINDPLVKESLSLKLLYRNKPALARGHLVGVTWRDIDPQRTHKVKKIPKEPPFFWMDGDILTIEKRRIFENCDVRTEYLPMYPIVAPDMSWRKEYGPQPEFNPIILSESYTVKELERNLLPLKEGYKNWIQGQYKQLKDLDKNFTTIAKIHLEDLEKSCKRISEGISLLINNEDARLAFCFMNKVIAKQQSWARRDKEVKVFPWRPFQLAFILQNISSLFNDEDKDRNTVDLLFFATGGGKTESYLGLAIFNIALARLRAKKDKSGHRIGSGVNVLSRYTLRLLTIQQYRRALRVVTAAEFLRTFGHKEGTSIGWRPASCHVDDEYIWGTERISIGLFVGGGVTPNSMHTLNFTDESGSFQHIPGAIDLLKRGGNKSYGEPAQILNCPCCNSHLAIPSEGLSAGSHTLYFLFKAAKITVPIIKDINIVGAKKIVGINVKSHDDSIYHTASITFEIEDGGNVKKDTIYQFWEKLKTLIGENVSLLCASPTRMGYFIRTYLNSKNNFSECDFEIYCPSPSCELNSVYWTEKVPINIGNQMVSNTDMEFQEVLDCFKVLGESSISYRTPITAYTVDDQVYHKCPSMIIATVDKFAQLASEPRAATIFGNVEYYHARWGYYRENCPPSDGGNLTKDLKSHPSGYRKNKLYKRINSFNPPSLIIQDEMHLIEGPLGSMFGLYEIAIDELCTKYSDGKVIRPKIVVSTATVSQAQTQIRSLFGRDFVQFPSPGLNIEDNFFSFSPPTVHPLDSEGPGRLYIGVCSPGKGAQTPLVRMWSNLLQNAKNLLEEGFTKEAVDGFWTVVGYFNAVRELAGAASLYRQDIPERMEYIAGVNARDLSTEHMELSSRKDSMELPSLLDQLEISLQTGTPVNAVLATSMFGTGVDVDRLRCMIINGQPKSTSSYIQSSGRVGRSKGGLVLTFFRASRPRDLDHYEHFMGYHHSLYKNVEPITVAPFSPRARERALGPVITAILRNAKMINGFNVDPEWRIQQRLLKKHYISGASLMATKRTAPEVINLIEILLNRLEKQPEGRKPEYNKVQMEIRSELDRWKGLAQIHDDLLYKEPSMASTPTHAVVLGDLQHFFNNLDMAFENAPSSLRDVEGTTTFKG
ncbi:helicase-like protein [Cytobacillus oceanisediminis]|uniref:Helicase-like protein n=1 Tax=Cytobacillus oceanisediminis TaxID=665099 RepID=A0A2V3AEQ9_9BACI|nr:DISARM system helicase DrmA [Cytobacillus oceanisediminis]PWW32315.1 helicase-like protein [Cytobacillus oceanisediminis]